MVITLLPTISQISIGKKCLNVISNTFRRSKNISSKGRVYSRSGRISKWSSLLPFNNSNKKKKSENQKKIRIGVWYSSNIVFRHNLNASTHENASMVCSIILLNFIYKYMFIYLTWCIYMQWKWLHNTKKSVYDLLSAETYDIQLLAQYFCFFFYSHA